MTTLEARPLIEPDPNLLAQSRMRLDEALDAMPPHGLPTRLRSQRVCLAGPSAECAGAGDAAAGRWLSGRQLHLPLPGCARARLQPAVILTNTTGGGVSSISGITQLPGDMVQVSYNRVVPEMVARLAGRSADSSAVDGGDARRCGRVLSVRTPSACWRMSADGHGAQSSGRHGSRCAAGDPAGRSGLRACG